MKPVLVTLTSKTVGESFIFPYERGMKPRLLPVYKVPLYQINVGATRTFKAVRFGLTPLIMPPPHERVCNVGLNAAQILTPEWVPGYGPHSFTGGELRGAWRLKPGQQFLIHQGATREENQLGGSLGCVELAGSAEWKSFMLAVQMETGVSSFAEIAQRRLLRVDVQATSFPTAILDSIYDRDTGLSSPPPGSDHR